MWKIFSLNRRDIIGLVGWLIVGLIIGIFAIPLMVAREVYQWKHYHLPRFEWEDVVRYSIVIAFGSIAQYIILGVLDFNL